MSMTPASSKYFEQNAGQWDALRTGYFSEGVRAAAIAKAYLRPEMTAADVGAGTGFIAAGLAPLVQKVYLLDGSEAMLAVARQNLAPFDNVEYHLADAQSLPLPDGSVDVAFANMYLHHCPDPLAAMREMVRILKPGGRLVITDADAHNHTWMREEMADVWLGFERSQVRDWLQQAGFVNILIDCTGQSCCAESGNPAVTDPQDRSAAIGVFVATGTRRIPMREQVKSAYSAAAQAGSCCGSQAVEAQAPASSSCCGESSAEAKVSSKSCCSAEVTPTQESIYAGIYSADELASVPPEAGEISLGCGNPIALANLKAGEIVVDIGSGGGIDSFLAARKVPASVTLSSARARPRPCPWRTTR